MEQNILAILQDINPYVDIEENSKLIDEGILDSLGILVLISELEEKHHITIPLETLGLENFETVASIAELVKDCIK